MQKLNEKRKKKKINKTKRESWMSLYSFISSILKNENKEKRESEWMS